MTLKLTMGLFTIAFLVGSPSAHAGTCSIGAPTNSCGSCRVEAQCGGKDGTTWCLAKPPKGCKSLLSSKKLATTRVKKKVGGVEVDVYIIDLFSTNPGKEMVFLRFGGISVTTMDGRLLAREDERGHAGGGEAIKILRFSLLPNGKKAILSGWSWCVRTEDGFSCIEYIDMCWESGRALRCHGPD